MKQLIRGIIIAIVFFIPSFVYAEEIADFQSTIAIHTDGSFLVKEKILYDFGHGEKHGIYRNLIQTRINEFNESYRFGLSDITISDAQNAPYPFTKSTKNDQLQLKIGDADVFVTGKKEYNIGYTVRGGITYFSDHDELFWQITGTEWTVDIATVSATITLPIATDAAYLRLACLTGTPTSDASDCDIFYDGENVVASTRRLLSQGEGLTIAIGFPKGIVAVVEPEKVVPFEFTWLGKIIFFICILFALFWYIVFPIWIIVHWFQTGRDPSPPMGETKAWFDVPKATDLRPLTPGETGSLVDEHVDMRDITATIVDLARRGYLKIIETKKNRFSLEKVQKQSHQDTLEAFESILYNGIFEGKTTLALRDADLSSVVSKTRTALYEALVKEKFFEKNPNTTRTIYTALGVFAIFTVNFPLALAAFLFGRAMPKKTLLGSQNAVIARSLKNFLVSQDRQFAYQAKKQLFFEKFLPYAIAFGVEKIWADRFNDIKLTKPDWYEGYQARAFTSMYFINSLNTSMNSVVRAATPTSSSSGFSSGFSGGSVGGGGGGGGGGSW